MEDARGRQLVVADVVRGEGVVGAGAVQEAPVHAGRADDDGVAGDLARADDHVGGELGIPRPQRLEHGAAEQVVADLAHEPHRDAQSVQGQPDVRHGSAGRHLGRSDLQQPARLDPRRPGQHGDHVEADMPGDDDLGR